MILVAGVAPRETLEALSPSGVQVVSLDHPDDLQEPLEGVVVAVYCAWPIPSLAVDGQPAIELSDWVERQQALAAPMVAVCAGRAWPLACSDRVTSAVAAAQSFLSMGQESAQR